MIAIREWPPFKPQVPTLATGTYQDVLREADLGGYFGQGDGAVNTYELQQYNNNLGQQIALVSLFRNFFGGGFFGQYFDSLLKDLRTKQTATQVMLDNFGGFANAGDRNGFSISSQDITSIAGRDGNGANISNQDVNGPYIPPIVIPALHERLAMHSLEQDFDKIDANKDGILTNEEISTYRGNNINNAYNTILVESHELMFASIDPGNAAWHGLSKQDVAQIKTRLANGESLQQISDSLRAKIAAERGVAADEAGFKAYVDQNRQRFPLPGGNPNVPPVTRWDPATGTKGFVTTLYQNILGRSPENQQVIDSWAAHMDRHGVAATVKGFFNSSEFKGKNLSTEDTVELLYHSILGRDSDAGGKAFWVSRINNGMSLDQVIDSFVASPEYQEKAAAGTLPAPGGGTPAPSTEANAVKALQDNFANIDRDKNGVITDQEIERFRRESGTRGLVNIMEESHELMFASIDPGNPAWHGLTAKDLEVISGRLAKGETIDQIAAERRATIAAERGVAADEAGFEAYVKSMRDRFDIQNAGAQAGKVAELSAGFKAADKDKNGVLDAAEIRAASNGNPTLRLLAELNRELMFASIDPGRSAWFGLSEKDFAAIIGRLEAGETLEVISNELRAKIAAERGVASDTAGFRKYVDDQRKALA